MLKPSIRSGGKPLAMDHLKEGIGLRGYGQKDSFGSIRRGYEMFIT